MLVLWSPLGFTERKRKEHCMMRYDCVFKEISVGGVERAERRDVENQERWATGTRSFKTMGLRSELGLVFYQSAVCQYYPENAILK